MHQAGRRTPQIRVPTPTPSPGLDGMRHTSWNESWRDTGAWPCAARLEGKREEAIGESTAWAIGKARTRTSQERGMCKVELA